MQADRDGLGPGRYGGGMPTVSLVTGATAGLGAAFARRLAAEGSDLVLVARDLARLESTASDLQQRYGVRADPLPADLGTHDGCAAVEARLAAADRPVDMLVNNAGFGLPGRFLATPADEHERLFRVLGLAVLRLTHAAAGAMVARGRGDLLNVSSVAGFVPSARESGSYAASKAFVTALSESVAAQLVGTGVRVSAVCPGFVHTEFHQRAGMNTTGIPRVLWLNADDVVAAALRDHRAGKVVSVPGAQYKMIVTASRAIPRGVFRRVTRLVARRAQ